MLFRSVLQNVRDAKTLGPVLVHVITEKGKGHPFAKPDPEKYHAIPEFDPETKALKKSSRNAPTFTSVFANALISEARADEQIVAITAAMPSGTGLDKFAAACRTKPELRGMVQTLFDTMFPRLKEEKAGAQTLDELLAANGFDREAHEAIRADLKAARIGLAQNRLPANTVIEDVRAEDVTDATAGTNKKSATERGLAALRNGEAAVVTLSAGAASRWTQGAGVVKSLHPFCKLGGRHRTFLEVHLAKSRKISRLAGTPVPHVFTTSYLTHSPLSEFLAANQNYGYEGPLLLSRGASVGLRLVPTARDLRFAWEEMPQQVLDEQQQKVRDSLRAALIRWAEGAGETGDYRDDRGPGSYDGIDEPPGAPRALVGNPLPVPHARQSCAHISRDASRAQPPSGGELPHQATARVERTLGLLSVMVVARRGPGHHVRLPAMPARVPRLVDATPDGREPALPQRLLVEGENPR